MTRILVVDESPAQRQKVARLLQAVAGWRVEFAEDNQAAIERLTLIPPDAVLTDLQPPQAVGLDLVRRIRRDFPHLPVILITSPNRQRAAIDALRAGATSFSPEDSLEEDLVETVQHVLEMARHLTQETISSCQPACHRAAFVIENDHSLIGPLIEHLQSRLPSWSDRDRLQIGMAMDEALSNAMHHGNLEVASKLREHDDRLYYEELNRRRRQSPYCRRKVKLEIEFSDQHICLQVSDEGPGFDPGDVPNPCQGENVFRVSGRGLVLIRSFMDQVAHNRRGNQITMTKLRRRDA